LLVIEENYEILGKFSDYKLREGFEKLREMKIERTKGSQSSCDLPREMFGNI
jgi:hypothetical protein